MRLPLGKIVITPAAHNKVAYVDIMIALRKHSAGDWGDVDAHDKKVNDQALKHGHRILSAYTSHGTKFWIITERDRSVTTILLPSDY